MDDGAMGTAADHRRHYKAVPAEGFGDNHLSMLRAHFTGLGHTCTHVLPRPWDMPTVTRLAFGMAGMEGGVRHCVPPADRRTVAYRVFLTFRPHCRTLASERNLLSAYGIVTTGA